MIATLAKIKAATIRGLAMLAALTLIAGGAWAQSDRAVSTVREKDAPAGLNLPDGVTLGHQPRYFLDTVDTLNRITSDRTRTSPGLAKNNYIGQVYEIRNTQAIEIQTYLLRILAYEGGIAEVMGADTVKDEKGMIQFLFVVMPEHMKPGIDELVAKCDRPGFKFFDATGGDFGGGPGAVKYVGKHRTASELVAILNGTEIGNVGGFLFPPFADDSTNAIYIIENPTDIADDIAALEMFDIPPLQLELECQIFEVEVSKEGTIGVDLDAWKQHLSGELTYSDDSPDEWFDKDFNNYYSMLTLDARAIVEFLNFTVQSGNAQIITSTKITMVNSEDVPGGLAGGARGSSTGNPAVIQSIVTIPYTVLQESDGPKDSSNSVNEVIDDKFEGVRVEILPFIGTQSITLNINAEVHSLTGYSKSSNIPIISERSMNSVCNLKDGQWTVLGGLEKQTMSKSNSGIPGLRKVPVLKYFFAKESYAAPRKSQVLIAVRPTLKKAEDPEPALDAMTQLIP